MDPILNPGAHVAPNIARPGRTICEQRLMLATYGTKVYTSIGRPIDVANLSRNSLREFKLRKSLVDNLSQPRRGECMEIQRTSTNKRKAETRKDEESSNKIAVLDAQIATLKSSVTNNAGVILPPAPNNNPLQPPTGFSQRGTQWR